jgi:hypothetical protein
MLDTVEKNNDKNSVKDDSATAAVYKPSIQIRRKQTRRLVAQVVSSNEAKTCGAGD